MNATKIIKEVIIIESASNEERIKLEKDEYVYRGDNYYNQNMYEKIISSERIEQ
ncbi:MAG TPA: hypothetical protein PLR64_04040 [Candidatus Dojkabacteria bacterium]|nr:hypothetical protein [Candidatus Dojkabacteria bacterium]